MNYRKLIFITILLIGLSGIENVYSRVVVHVKPVAPKTVVVKPRRPGKKYVWIEGHWKWNAKHQKYVWIDGRWVKPPQNKVWKAGYWKKVPNGWVWISGTWVVRR